VTVVVGGDSGVEHALNDDCDWLCVSSPSLVVCCLDTNECVAVDGTVCLAAVAASATAVIDPAAANV